MPKRKSRYAAGTRVRTTMGVRLEGTISRHSWPYRECTDGTYRDPMPHERPVYVEWDGGTRGWVTSYAVEIEEGGAA